LAAWGTIEDIARTRGLEVIVNFPLSMAITRLITRDGEIPASWQARLDTSFGTSDWRDLAYVEENTIFGPRKVKRLDADDRLLAWYLERLEKAFGFVGPAQLVTNTRGNPLYYLLWAGPNKAGLEGAAYILGRRKPSRRRS
jgi:three-Cys-motif partner protein